MLPVSAKSGIGQFSLQLLMGHSDISTTAIYIDDDPNARRKLVEKHTPKLTI